MTSAFEAHAGASLCAAQSLATCEGCVAVRCGLREGKGYRGSIQRAIVLASFVLLYGKDSVEHNKLPVSDDLRPLLGNTKGEHSAGDGFDPFHASLCKQRLPCDIHSGCSDSPRERCWQEPLASPSWEDWVCSQLRMELPPQQA